MESIRQDRTLWQHISEVAYDMRNLQAESKGGNHKEAKADYQRITYIMHCQEERYVREEEWEGGGERERREREKEEREREGEMNHVRNAEVEREEGGGVRERRRSE